MRKFCSTCATAIDGTRQYCATCGIFLGWKAWAPPLDARVCKQCEAPNAPERTACGRCNADLATGRDAASDPYRYCGQVYAFEHLPPAGPDRELGPPRADGGCRLCGTINESGTVFCGSCGYYLEWDSPPTPDAVSNAGPEVPV